ncbi:MAG: DUF1552 domain-containing protein [Myxococcales bacterium]|nr:DUF1552 domain-containing protein [Myxococcales bacterium]
MKRFTLNRRTMLRGVLGGTAVALALPPLEAMLNANGTAYANGDPLPRRFVTWFFGNGVALVNPFDPNNNQLKWTPPDYGPGYSLPTQLAPLSGVKEYCSVISNLEVRAKHPEVRGHHTGVSGFFSGYPYIKLDPMGANYSSKFGGPSFDQVAASFIGDQTFLPSVELRSSKRIVTSEGPTLNYLSHKGPDQPLQPIHNPQEAFQKLFGGFVPPDDPTKPLRLSALDAVAEDVKRLQMRVGSNDRQRLDAHLSSIAQIQKQIESIAPECSAPPQPGETNSDQDGKEPLDSVNKVMSDLLILAFHCDITRVASIQYTGSVGYTVFHMLGQSQGHHDLSHDANANDQVDAATIKTMEAFAYLLQGLKDTPEGDGNLLDNSCLLLGSDAASGLRHSDFNQPCIVAGRGGGALTHPGIHHDAQSANSTDVLLACLKTVAPQASEAGGGNGHSTTPLGAIMA